MTVNDSTNVDLTITKIVVEPETGDVTFFFDEDDLEHPWSVREFNPGSPTRLWLEEIQRVVKKGE